MKIEQHNECGQGIDLISLDLQLQTKSDLAHKLLTESPEMIGIFKEKMWKLSEDIIDFLSHEYQVRFPKGLK